VFFLHSRIQEVTIKKTREEEEEVTLHAQATRGILVQHSQSSFRSVGGKRRKKGAKKKKPGGSRPRPRQKRCILVEFS
jgi:hypothetical protein